MQHANASPIITEIVKDEPQTDNAVPGRVEEACRPTTCSTSITDNFLALWQSPAATTANETHPGSSFQQLGGLSIGSFVFAPHRVRVRGKSYHPSGAARRGAAGVVRGQPQVYTPHYALAEVTGIQACAGTVTVAFLFCDPGIDDDAISIYEVIPCPPACLTHWVQRRATDPSYRMCSLLERVLGISPDGPPLPVQSAFQRTLQYYKERRYPQSEARLPELYCLSDQDSDTEAMGNHAEEEKASSSALEPQHPHPLTSGVAVGVKRCRSPEPAGAGPAGFISATYEAPASLHAFFANIFQRVNHYIEQQRRLHRDLPALSPSPLRPFTPFLTSLRDIVILCIFDSYVTLRRFEMYMTLRGHLVQLLDGSASPSNVANNMSGPQSSSSSLVCQGSPPPSPTTRNAFGGLCKVWLCMLRDDAEGEEPLTNTQVALRQLLIPCPPLDYVVSFIEVLLEDDNSPHHPSEGLPKTEASLITLLPGLQQKLMMCHLHNVPTSTARQATPAGATSPVVKVSGELFGKHKILVPCSPEQLLLMKTVLITAPTSNGESELQPPRQRSGKPRIPSPPQRTEALAPTLLERIALGNFTDTAAASLLDAFEGSVAIISSRKDEKWSKDSVEQCGVVATLSDVHRKLYIDPSLLGEAFPIFSAVSAIVQDVFADSHSFQSRHTEREPLAESINEDAQQPNSGQQCFLYGHRRLSFCPMAHHRNAQSADVSDPLLPRIALVLPHGNPTHHPSLNTAQFLHSLRLFFSPWALYEVSATAIPSATTAAMAAVLWHQRGGLLLLHCDEATTQLGALQDEADVVIACGKAAAAWVAANSTSPSHRVQPITYFAVLSEVELVTPPTVSQHIWLPVTVPVGSTPIMTEAEEEETSTPTTETAQLWKQLRSLVVEDHDSTAASRQRRQQYIATLPKTMMQAVVLWHQLSQSTAPPLTRNQASVQRWYHVRHLAKTIALLSAFSAPVQLSNMELLHSASLVAAGS